MVPSGATVVQNSFHKIDFLWNLDMFNEKPVMNLFFLSHK